MKDEQKAKVFREMSQLGKKYLRQRVREKGRLCNETRLQVSREQKGIKKWREREEPHTCSRVGGASSSRGGRLGASGRRRRSRRIRFLFIGS